MSKFFVVLVAFLLGGCATIEKNAGFDLAAGAQSVFEPQEPWQAVVLWDVDIRKGHSFVVVRVPLPKPLSAVWRWDMNDHRRAYSVGEGARVLRRSVWRAPVFDGTSLLRTYNAVLNEDRTAMFVLVPGGEERMPELLRQNLLILSADACFVQTTSQAIVPIPEFGALPLGIFAAHPSPITPDMLFLMDETTETGRRFLADLRKTFPEFAFGRHSARADVVDVSTLTAEVGTLDRFVSKGSISVGASMLTAGPVSPFYLIGVAVRNRDVFSGNVCKDTHEQLSLKSETVSRLGE